MEGIKCYVCSMEMLLGARCRHEHRTLLIIYERNGLLHTTRCVLFLITYVAVLLCFSMYASWRPTPCPP